MQFIVGMTVASVYGAVVLGLMTWYIAKFIPQSKESLYDRLATFMNQNTHKYTLLVHATYPVQVVTGMYSRLAPTNELPSQISQIVHDFFLVLNAIFYIMTVPAFLSHTKACVGKRPRTSDFRQLIV